jgi:acyl dehydratase
MKKGGLSMGSIDPAVVGTALPQQTVEVERGRLRAFAQAIGETDPVYTNVEAAQAAGHPDLPVPPTFLFGLGLGRGAEDFAWLTGLGVDLRHVLHGEQGFTYHALAYAGDTLTLSPKITDVFSKRGGTLQFLVRRTVVERAGGTPVAELHETIVVRDPAGTR